MGRSPAALSAPRRTQAGGAVLPRQRALPPPRKADAGEFSAMLRCTMGLAGTGGQSYFRDVRGAFGRCLLGRFLPKLGGALGPRPSFLWRPLTAACALALLGTIPAAAQTTKIRAGYTSGGDVSAAFVARDQGMFARRGLDVTLTMLAFGSVLPPALESGSMEIATPTAPVLLQANDNGIELVAVSGGSVSTRDSKNHALVTRNGLDLKTAQDFAGKRIGIAGRGGFFDLLFQEWMLKNGIKPDRFTIIEIGQPQMSDMLKGGSVDAVVAADPNITRMLQTGVGKVSLYIDSQYPDGLPVIVWAAARRWVAANRDAAKGFAEAIAEASTWAQAHPEEWRHVIAGYTGLPLAMIQAASLPNLQAALTAEQLALWNPIMRDQGLLTADVDTRKLLQW